MSFAQWARVVSRDTNRSLAGSSLYVPQDASDIAAQAQQWGMRLAADEVGADFTYDAVLAGDAEAATGAVLPAHASHFTDKEASAPLPQMSGAEAIDHARMRMPVTRKLIAELAADGALTGVRFAISIVLEPKTAVFLEELAAAGAVVGIYCDGESTDPRVIEELEKRGIEVSAQRAWSAERRRTEALKLLDDIQPDILIDDGASFARLLMRERPQMAANLIGVAEETTSGVRAFAAMDRDRALTYPVIAVNDSALKTNFDNAHGTGETCVTTMLDILGSDAFAGASVAVVGYGPVGAGFARRIRALGAKVTICDIDPVACLRAVFDGFETADLASVAGHVDMVTSATGVRHTVSLETMRRMRERAILGVIGGISNELALDDITGFARANAAVRDLDVPGGSTVRLLSDGDGVNYTAGNGNPIDIMDLSFAVQTMAIGYLLKHRGRLEKRLMTLDSSADEHIARVALSTRGQEVTATHTVPYDWRLSRFEDEIASENSGEKEHRA
ncbi:MAG: adenosylhomocysteinase [Bifidobacteriaceae bacterium]|nr:adenosylhomocysteinase [Bifidobacteriaceae bacterium]